MSTLRVTAERLTVHPHPNADALELAQVGLFRAVVAKGAYRTGDWAVYIPENALLPDGLIDELGLTGKLAGSRRNRVKAIRLRGEISQGVVCSPRALADRDLAAAHEEGADFAAELGVTKWVPEIPVHMSGEVVAAPDLLRWIEVENAKRYPDVFTPGEPVVATEKIHGTACLFTLVAETGEEFVSSKGHGSRNFALAFAEDNLYWRSVRTHGVPEAARRIAEKFGAARVGVFGEVFGAGVQDLGYGEHGRSERPGYAVFDVRLDVDGTVSWVDAADLPGLLAEVGLPAVPELYNGPYDEAALFEAAQGDETWSGRAAHLREGVVVRPSRERYSPVLAGRAIAKFVSDAYLTRKGGTEYE
ncbi:RNA ligase (ATP) [Nocardiopsis changdeensis]|uniref:RNA ligase (ATP) n=1 Tax=Nocardiopsis changdeensis TaxID=2831969 RepID=A0ABX8BTQ8_9ACTN|nr:MULTISPECIES: RNA ligase (ATP) [Nocardiopsis]QUX25248.1 RNA ligase (ATP) [Nocardiopsis changdeensis]QYX35635.1 RNA ligase (ATP) [Nocardiopsis sp. MT53]